MKFWGILLTFVLCLTGGCVNPCEDLAERRCEQVGVNTDTCTSIREEASEASISMRRECSRAMKMGETLSKNR